MQVGVPGELHVGLIPDSRSLGLSGFAVDQVVGGVITGPHGVGHVLDGGLQLVQVVHGLCPLLAGEELAQRAQVVVQVVEEFGMDGIGPAQGGVVPLQQLCLLGFQGGQFFFHLVLPV